MKITAVTPVVLSIPFHAGGDGEGIMPTTWNTLDFCLVRIETDRGLIGWGEGFGYFCSQAVAAIIRRSIAPLLAGRELADPRTINEELQRKLVLQGRYGISTFALSGVDIALWDLWAKAEGVSVATLVAGRERTSVAAYASLVRYADQALVRRYAEAAVADGFSEIKLHEITMPEIRACRQAVGGEVPMTVDLNCNWTREQARAFIPQLVELRTRWLEEPIFPPEDFLTLASLRCDDLAIATGENACTAYQFEQLCHAGAADIMQPSVTKVGGITEFLKVLDLPFDLDCVPHSPYFGPGYLATLQMAVVAPRITLFEYLYIRPDAWLYGPMPLPEQGKIPIPCGPGLGMDPRSDVIERYAV